LILHSGLSAIKQLTESARLVVSVIYGSLAVPNWLVTSSNYLIIWQTSFI